MDFVVIPGSPVFLGHTYYHSLKAMGKFTLGSSTEGECRTQEIFSGPHVEEIMSVLTMDQRLRLYRGLWSLLSLQSKLQGVPRIEQIEGTCTEHTHDICLELWSSLWKEGSKHNGLTSIDPGQLIDEAKAKFKSRGATFTKARCHASMERELDTLKKEFELRLPDYFT